MNDSNVIGFMPTGISIRCSMLDTALKSSLTCWFNQECFANFYEFMSAFNPYLSTNVTILNGNVSSRFLPDSTVELMVNELMVEYYHISVNFSKYYGTCHPRSCIYTYKERSSRIYIATTIFALIGGLNVVLRLISPLLIKPFHRRQRSMHGMPPSVGDRWVAWKKALPGLNLFATGSTDMVTLRQERMSTRIYLLLLLSSIIVIIIYTVAPTNMINQRIDSPPSSAYQALLARHGSSLHCPCTQISLPYRDLLVSNATYHQVCSSDFVDPAWFSAIAYTGDDPLLRVHDDFRVILPAYFRMVSTLCARARMAVVKVTDELSTKLFLSSSAMSEAQFLSNMNDTTSQFKESAASEFSRTMHLLRGYLHANTFISSYDLNWYFWTDQLLDFATLWNARIMFNNSCSCGTRRDCISFRPFFSVLPGLAMGCSVLEGVMRSNLMSLYNQTVLDNLDNYLTKAYVKRLNDSVISRFPVHSSVEKMVDGLFVEEWYFNSSYTSFYNRCAPRYCSYTVEERNDALYVVSRILGLYGGLSVSFWLMSPSLTRLCLHLKFLH